MRVSHSDSPPRRPTTLPQASTSSPSSFGVVRSMSLPYRNDLPPSAPIIGWLGTNCSSYAVFCLLARAVDGGAGFGGGGGRAGRGQKRGMRRYHNRLAQASATQRSSVAVPLPLCVAMSEDGVRALKVQEPSAVRDIAEIGADA